MSGNDFQGLGTEGDDLISTEDGSGIAADVACPSTELILEAVISRLNLDLDLLAIVTGVFNDVPNNQGFPYIRVSLGQGREYDTKDSNGLDHSILVHIWTNKRGDKQVHQIMDKVYKDLHDRPLGGLVTQSLLLMFDNFSTMIEPDGAHHGRIEFRHIATG